VNSFADVFPSKPIIGMLHLRALPGAPEYSGRMSDIIDPALVDASALQGGGVDGIMIENFFDAPFFKDQVGPETIAAMARVMSLIRPEIDLPLGVNVLRNDGRAALAIATACECQFVRINQVSWAMLTDQGILEGKAAEVARYRRYLDSGVLIFADCLTKHAVPLAPQSIELVALDTWERGGVDAIIISGPATGRETDVEDVLGARKGAPAAPILIGSGVTLENLHRFLPVADGILVGTYFKEKGHVAGPVDKSRVESIVNRRRQFLEADEEHLPPGTN
jgi:membrane complex biogenesis BtpA family protein